MNENTHSLVKLIQQNNQKVAELVAANNARLMGGGGPTGPFAESLLNDSALGTVFLAMTEFIMSVPTAVVNNVKIVVAEKGVVELSLPLASLFDGFITRRAELLAQGVDSMADEVVTVKNDVPENYDLFIPLGQGRPVTDRDGNIVEGM